MAPVRHQESKHPWFQFFSGDWLKDPKLSMCQPATRGIWIDVISAAHELRCGTLTGTPEQLARVCRCTVPDLRLALADLSTTGAADIRERDGIISITCRRLAREAKTREVEREKKRKQRSNAQDLGDVPACPVNVPYEKAEDNCIEINDLSDCPYSCPDVVPEKSLLIYDLYNKENIKNKNIRKLSLEKKRGCGGKEKPTALFEQFWEAYPRKDGSKKLASEKFKALNPDSALFAAILSAIDQAMKSEQWQIKKFIPHAATWLNQRRWECDPPPVAEISPQARAPAQSRMAVLDQMLAECEAEEAASG